MQWAGTAQGWPGPLIHMHGCNGREWPNGQTALGMKFFQVQVLSVFPPRAFPQMNYMTWLENVHRNVDSMGKTFAVSPT